MAFFRSLSLRQLLTVPYVVLVLLLAVMIGLLSYRAGRTAVDSLSGQLLGETVGRISQAVEKHVFGSAAVLEVAFPEGLTAPARLADDLDALRTRFWQATSVHRELNNYAYYGDEQGHFFGLWRDSAQDAQVRLRTAGSGPRTLYRMHGIRGPLVEPVVEDKVFEPRERPWYQASRDSGTEIWTSIYIDFRTQGLVATRARRVPNADGGLGGVVATDVSLQSLSDFVRSLPLSPNGLAFVAEPDGKLIATSRGSYLRQGADGRSERLDAEQSDNPLLVATHRAVRELMALPGDHGATRTIKISGPDGAAVQVAWARIRDAAGLDWVIAVAVPRSDFLQRITDNVYRTLGLAVLAALLAIGIGLASLSVVARDLRQLSVAARRVGEGDFNAPLGIRRGDEIGDLAKSFQAMTQRLTTDRLTGLANREAVLRRLEERMARQRRSADGSMFAVLFIDLDRFKEVNDRFGHDAGDRVLVALGQRLQAQLREGDMVARWAGDEFLVLLDQISTEADARHVVDKLKRCMELPLEAPGLGQDIELSLSVGVAIYPRDGQDVDTLVQRADVAMYRDKPGQSG
ncbi:MAG: diguanylate cyclase [Burkholderiales bacterium]|nr:diguanylate cyclase [Burkholderiales bacterium]